MTAKKAPEVKAEEPRPAGVKKEPTITVEEMKPVLAKKEPIPAAEESQTGAVRKDVRPAGEEPKELKRLVEAWKKAWEQKDLSAYLSFYDSGFQSRGMDFKAWKKHREKLNQKYRSIAVGISNRRWACRTCQSSVPTGMALSSEDTSSSNLRNSDVARMGVLAPSISR